MNKNTLTSSDISGSQLSRRDILSASAAGALVIGFRVPRAKAQIIDPEGAAWALEPEQDEVNAWVIVAPDNSVTIRIAQTEIGQGVWTSNAMMVAEELQCDWSKVRPEYASVNRDAREMAPEWTLNVMGNGAAVATLNFVIVIVPAQMESRIVFTGACAPMPPRRSVMAAIIFSWRAPKRASGFCSQPQGSGAFP
jgi:isoquinoline 1-oxidoreductase beta subunit